MKEKLFLNMHRYLAVLIFIMSGFELSAQSSLVKSANKLFDEKAYESAIPKYEKVIKNDSNNFFVLSRLADCYRFTNNAKGQVVCYGRLIESGEADEIQKLYYGKALMEVGDYAEAKLALNQTKDKRGKVFLQAISNMKTFSKNQDAYLLDTVSFNSPQNDFSPCVFSGDQIVFTSARTKTQWISKKHAWTGHNYYNLYVTKKGKDGKYIKPAKFMKDLNSKYNTGPVCFSKDGNAIYFTRNSSGSKVSKDGTYKLKIFQATLNRDGFENVIELPFNNSEYNCVHPALSSDGSTIYFASDMGGGKGGLDIYYSKLGADGKWGTPVNLGDKINTKGNEMFPFITPDNVLYFASDGLEGLGGLDIFEVKIKDNEPKRVYNMGLPINSRSDDFGFYIREDNKSGFLSSNRKAGGTNDDIYSFEVLRPVKRGKDVKIIVKDKYTGEVIPEAAIAINAESVKTNSSGEHALSIEEDVNYNLIVNKEKYFEVKDSLSTKSSELDEFTREILLDKDPEAYFLALVTDEKTNQPLQGVKITIKDSLLNSLFDTITTAASGEYKKLLSAARFGDKYNYVITLEKAGYLLKTVYFKHQITKSGEIKLNETLNLTLSKIQTGIDLGKLANLNPIYFDVGKSDIRPDAAVELDKIVKIMKEYPGMVVELGSHTDCRSAAAANLKLSNSRAKASAAYIVSKGIDKGRITGKGYGEKKLLNNCACEGKVVSACSEEEHAKNRRTEFIVTKYKEPVIAAAAKPVKTIKSKGKK